MQCGQSHICMSLPFMRRKQESGLSGITVKYRSPDDKTPDESGKDNSAMEAAAADLLRAFEQKDIKHIALALCSAFQIYESHPHSEESDSEGQE